MIRWPVKTNLISHRWAEYSRRRHSREINHRVRIYFIIQCFTTFANFPVEYIYILQL